MPRKILTLKILKMNANELRIGNYVLLASKTLYQVDILYKDYVSLNYWQAIPLTEEWLLRFGKKADKEDSFGGFIIYYPNGNGMRIKDNEWKTQHLSVKIEFVHQLQNLYFSLTQTELTAN